ncbi:hypothetical protein EDC01DRAFT_623782 [Geopyxis carbonaria]|nr:hypothetical protein EDC01DRAFT_623782 [Geopyxis carbonaria]
MKAALKAGRDLQIEAWTLMGVAWIFIILRITSRLISVPFRSLHPDDYLVVVAGLVYFGETICIHFIASLGGSNNMPPELRALLTPDAIVKHTLASKLFITGWVEYGLTVWLMKGCMCFFFFRIFQGLPAAMHKTRIALWAVCITYVIVFITTMCECVPFHKNWQVVPDPGQQCTQGLAKHIVILITNVSTDVLLISIPLPIFLASTMPLYRKVIISLLFGAGLFVTVAAILRSSFVFQDLYSSVLMAQWAARESCVGFVVNNAPMLSPLIKRLRHKITGHDPNAKPFNTKDVFSTFHSRSRRKAQKGGAYTFTTTMGGPDGDDDDAAFERAELAKQAALRPPTSESTTGMTRGIRVDYEVELQYQNHDLPPTPPSLPQQLRKKGSEEGSEDGMRGYGSGMLAGPKGKGEYTAKINAGSPASP